jgi:hypothetical protein
MKAKMMEEAAKGCADENDGDAPPHGQHASPEAGSPASLPLLVIGHSCICRRKGGLDAETEELADGDPGHGPAGSALCNPIVARQRLHREAREERAPPSEAPGCSWSAARIEEEGGIVATAEEPWTQLATRIPKELHRRLRLYCVTHDIVLMRFVAAAIEEKLGRKRGSRNKTA